jgi:pimeloyl-ACP methyl ester carboxylesterase
LHVRQFGSGPRSALALHCTLSHGGSWRGLAELLGDRLSVTACDLPGHGKSPEWDRARDIHDQCTEAVMPLLQRQMDLIGHSFGATVALRLAIEAPERVRSLCLIEPVLFAAAALEVPEALTAYREAAEPFSRALRDGNMPLAARLFNREWGDGRGWDRIPERTRAYITARMDMIPAQEPALSEDSACLLAPERLARAQMPVLLMDGTQSPPIVMQINAALANRLPDARRVRVAGAGHMAPMTHPEAVARAIGAFLEKT